MLVGPLRIRVACTVTIVSRVGVNNGANCPLFSGQLWLNPSPGAPVARNRNFSFNADTVPLENFIIRRRTVVYKDQLAFNLSVCRKCVVGWQQVVDARGARIFSKRVFSKTCGVAVRRYQFKLAGARRRKENLIFGNFDLVAPLFKTRRHKIHHSPALCRPHMMGITGQYSEPFLLLSSGQAGIKFRFQRQLCCSRLVIKTEQALRPGSTTGHSAQHQQAQNS